MANREKYSEILEYCQYGDFKKSIATISGKLEPYR